MSRYQTTFARLNSENKTAFIPFWMLGDPDPETSLDVVKTLARNADILELGLPFSDPLADGQTVQDAVNRSLRSGTTTAKCFKIIKHVRSEFPDKPIGLLVYLNLILQFGLNKFFAQCQEDGVDSILIPELPVEEIDLVKSVAAKHQIDLIFLLSTNTPTDRCESIYQHGSGFLYMVSSPSITGAKTKLSPNTMTLVKKLKSETDLPICVGFGVSETEHIPQLKTAGADGVIIGSKLINLYQKDGLEALEAFCKKAFQAAH